MAHKLTPDDVVLSDVPGYWRVKEPCPGGKQCRHAFRGALGPCAGGGTLTLKYAEYGLRNERGQFVSPYRYWREQTAEGGE